MTIILTQLGIVINDSSMYTYYDIPNPKEMIYHINLEVINEPPKNLECPELWDNEAKLSRILLIDSDEVDYRYWSGCLVHWNDKDWVLTSIISVGVAMDTQLFHIELETVKYRRMKMCHNESCK